MATLVVSIKLGKKAEPEKQPVNLDSEERTTVTQCLSTAMEKQQDARSSIRTACETLTAKPRPDSESEISERLALIADLTVELAQQLDALKVRVSEPIADP